MSAKTNLLAPSDADDPVESILNLVPERFEDASKIIEAPNPVVGFRYTLSAVPAIFILLVETALRVAVLPTNNCLAIATPPAVVKLPPFVLLLASIIFEIPIPPAKVITPVVLLVLAVVLVLVIVLSFVIPSIL